MQKEKPVLSCCGTCFPGLLESELESLQQHGMEHAAYPGAFTQEFPNWK